MNNSSQNLAEHNYKAYVGPESLFDFMGASQFRLLCSLGLRAHHTLLDIGCGSLRAGKLFINYLDEGNYYGIEPNKWLIEEAIKNEVGNDLIKIKKPHFDYNNGFDTKVFSREFDFIVAQSIFSHASYELVRIALHNSKDSLKRDGILAANFALGKENSQGTRWVYPELVNYYQATIRHLAKEAGFFMVRIPWYHPRLTWYLLTKEKDRLPRRAMLHHLSGAVLYDNAFLESWSARHKLIKYIRTKIGLLLPENTKVMIKKLINYKEPKL